MDLKKTILVTLLITVFIVGALSTVNAATKTTSKTSKVNKDTLKVSAPSVINTYKKSQNFKVTVKNKKTGTVIKNIKVNIKIYTGKKYKTYNKKTNNKGIIKINTKPLKTGKHKVVIKVKTTKKYKAKTIKSTIKIVKKSSKDSKTSPNSQNISLTQNTTNTQSNSSTEQPKTKLRTYMTNPLTSFKYYAGSPAGFDMDLRLKDENKKDLKNKTIEIYKNGNFYKTVQSGKSISIISNQGYQFLFKFLGDEEYEPCNYTYIY